MKNTWIPFGRLQLGVLVFALPGGLGAPGALGRQGGWPMYRGDAQNTSVSTHVGLRSVERAWDIPWGKYRWNRSGFPSVAPDGTIYMMVTYERPTLRGELMAVRPDGSVEWAAPLLDSQGRELRGEAAPLIGPDGAVYLGWLRAAGDSELIVAQAYDPQGSLLWSFEERIPDRVAASDGPIIGPDGTIYLALPYGEGGRGSLFALDSSDGSRIWRFSSPNAGAFYASPALGRNAKLYYASSDSGGAGRPGYLYRLDAATGELDWERRMEDSGASREPLTIDRDGNLYMAVDAHAGSRRVCTKYDPDGNELWTYEPPLGPGTRGSPVVQNGRVYLAISGSIGGRLDGVHVLDAANGRRRSILERNTYTFNTPVADRSGNVYFTSDYKLVGYSAAGQKLWEIAAAGSLVHNVVLGHDGLILTSPGTWGLSAFGAAVLVGDLNCDGAIDALDIEPFILILFDPPAYAARFPNCAGDIAGDINVDGAVNASDIEPFIGLLFP